jgi:hypothetical protein
MPDLKLAKLPERTPVKLSISLMPNLADALAAYAALYKQAYGREEAVADLVPAMLTAFLDSDRVFQKARSIDNNG